MEDEFLLLYHINGMNGDKVETMNYTDRQWWLNRLAQQFQKEKEAVNKKRQ